VSRTSFKHLVDKVTGYWIYKSGYLPIGADLRIDITRKAAYPNLNIIFDVGANHGQTYTKFRSDFPGAAIYSFEPVAESFSELRSKMRGDCNATPEQLAFGETVGEKTIRLFVGSIPTGASLFQELYIEVVQRLSVSAEKETLCCFCHSGGSVAVSG